MFRQNCPVRYPVIHASEGNIEDGFDGELCLNWVLLLFPSVYYPTEDYKFILAESGYDTWWHHSGSARWSGGALGSKWDEPRMSLSGGPSRISAVPNQIVYRGGLNNIVWPDITGRDSEQCGKKKALHPSREKLWRNEKSACTWRTISSRRCLSNDGTNV